MARPRALAAFLAVLALAVLAPAAQAGWSGPFEFSQPGSLDLAPPQLAFSPGGSAAAAFGVQDVDTPGDSQAYLGSRTAAGSVAAPRAIAGAREILALSFDGRALELLTGAGPANQDCCSSAQAITLSAGGVLQRPRTLIGGLAGASFGRLLTLGDGRLLAAVATQRGVWVSQSSRGDRFAATRRLTGSDAMPESLAAAWLGGESTIVAWTSATGLAGAATPRSISYAIGYRSGAPRRVRTLLTVPAGHRIDELSLARRGAGATAAWVESWYDRGGNFHSEVRAADVATHPGVRRLSAAGPPASGVTIAADAAGDQAVSWQTCAQNGSCGVHVTVRGSSATFGAGTSLGSVDAGQSPALTVGPRGQILTGWIRSGHPVAVTGSARRGGFGAARVLSSTIFALDLTVGFGPGRDALAVWTQGTLNPSVVAAAYRSP